MHTKWEDFKNKSIRFLFLMAYVVVKGRLGIKRLFEICNRYGATITAITKNKVVKLLSLIRDIVKKTCSGIKTLFEVCNKYGAGITAVATAVLAVITFFYMQETKTRRELLQKQFVLANSPNISIDAPFNFEFGNVLKTGIRISNFGSAVSEVTEVFSLICCDRLDKVDRKLRIRQHSSRTPSLGHNRYHDISVGLTDEDKDVFEKAAKDDTSSAHIYSYLQVFYTKLSLISGGNQEIVPIASSFQWLPKLQRWADLGKDEHARITKLLVENTSLP